MTSEVIILNRNFLSVTLNRSFLSVILSRNAVKDPYSNRHDVKNAAAQTWMLRHNVPQHDAPYLSLLHLSSFLLHTATSRSFFIATHCSTLQFSRHFPPSKHPASLHPISPFHPTTLRRSTHRLLPRHILSTSTLLFLLFPLFAQLFSSHPLPAPFFSASAP